jgi:chromate reductase
MKKTLTVLGIPGSPRTDSYNVKMLTVAGTLLPPGAELVMTRAFHNLPLSYYEANPGDYPPAVAEFKKEISSADAILFSTPQYNYSYPSILKIALQWGSLPESDNVWAGKPAAVIGACMDTIGTKEAVANLHKAIIANKMSLLPGHEVLIDSVKDKFDANGNFCSDDCAKKITELLAALLKLTGEK